MENHVKKHFVEYMIEQILGIYKKHMDISDDQYAVLQYSIRLLISSILSYAFTLGLALVLEIFPNVLIIILTVSVYRAFSGGAHCSCMGNCAIYGALTMNAIGLMTKFFNPSTSVMLSIIAFAFAFSLWAIAKYAPADTPGKPISSKVQYQKLKRMSTLVLCSWLFGCIVWYSIFNTVNIIVFASTMAMIWQSYTLTSHGYRFCHAMDSLISKLRFK